MGAIYIIFNFVSGMRYIGSSVDVETRLYKHRWHLRKGDHRNIHLQRAWDKYGETAFVFATLEDSVEEDDLVFVEQYYLDLVPEDALYNFCKIAWRPPDRSGHKMSEENKRKIIEANKRRVYGPHTFETKQKISKANSRPYPAFIHLQTGEVIPAGVGLARTCRQRGLPVGHMNAVMKGRAISCLGWALFDESKRMRHGNAHDYPALIHDDTGEIIPAGHNIRALCRKYNFPARSTFTAMIKGKYKQYMGWRIYHEEEQSALAI